MTSQFFTACYRVIVTLLASQTGVPQKRASEVVGHGAAESSPSLGRSVPSRAESPAGSSARPAETCLGGRRSRRRRVVAIARSVSPIQSSIACGVVRKSGTATRRVEKAQTPCVVSGFVEAIGGKIDLPKAFFFVSLLSRASNYKPSWNPARAA
jgi:hypothetical protein